MNIEDCKEGVKVRWDYYGKSDCGIIVKYKGSIWKDDNKDRVWVMWDSSDHEYPQYAELENLTLVEPPKQEERKYSKEEIIEYMDHIGYINVEANIQGIEEYFSADNEEERKAVQLLKERGYNVTKD